MLVVFRLAAAVFELSGLYTLSSRSVSRENEFMSDQLVIVDSAQIFRQFVTAINLHDVETLASMMSADHVFVDALGNRVQGAASMEAGWRGYFAMCPDYRI